MIVFCIFRILEKSYVTNYNLCTSKLLNFKRGCHSQNNISQFHNFTFYTHSIPGCCTQRCVQYAHTHCVVGWYLYSLCVCVHTLSVLSVPTVLLYTVTHIFTFTLYNYSTQHTRVQELFNAIPTTEQETV
jgi:hypothetical protein